MNPIEHWNALVKHEFRNRLLEALLERTNVNITPIVSAAVECIDNEKAKKIA